MELTILGCSGGKAPGHRLTCFMIDGRVLVDAGAITAALSLEQQLQISAVFLTHGHLDHICGLGYLYENTREHRHRPLDIYAPTLVIDALKTHLLSPEIMPGYRGPGENLEGLNFHPLVLREPFIVEGYEVEAIKVNHPAGGVGYFVSNGESTFANTGDTGATEEFWTRYNERGHVNILIVETSFPDELQHVADLSHHLTPRGLVQELSKLENTDSRIYVTHLKPNYLGKLTTQLKAIEKFKITLLRDGDVIRTQPRGKMAHPSRQQEVEARVADKIPEFDYAKDLYEQRDALTREFGVSFKSGEILFEQGDHSRIMYVIQEGKVRILRKIQGVERTLSILGPGEFFGEMAMLNNQPRSATAEAMTDVKVLAFDRPAFEKMVTENFGIAMKLIRTLAQRLQEADVIIENLMYSDPESKLVNTLIRLAVDEGIESKRGFILRVTPEDLAVRTGVRIATLREVLASLVKQKLVVVKKDSIVVPDLGKLHRYLKYLELRDEFPAGAPSL